MALAATRHIGRFEVLAPIGAGGMGEVFRARDPQMEREVAIKILPRECATDRERLRRFELEARAAGSLSHPNLITIYELGTAEGAPYMAMELLEGASLRDKLRRTSGGLPPRQAVEIAMQIANGLAAAHEKGLVHRDLKPENIFLTKSGQAKILDFGVVKLTADRGTLDSAQPTLPQTTPGVVVGTTSYMSPEQVNGGTVDQRSDIFSLGAVVYEMLSGHRAFHASTTVDTMSAILHEEPPPLAGEGSHISPALERIVRRCLEKEPRNRFDSAHDLMIALDTLGDSSTAAGSRTDAARRPHWRRSLVMGATAAVALVAVLIGTALWLDRRVRAVPATAKTIPRLVRLTDDRGLKSRPSISPDGASFVYAATPAGNFDILLRRIGGETSINLTKDCPDEDTMPAFSPDGLSIAFRSGRNGGGIFVMGATGESVRRLTDFGFDPAWSPDGKSIAFATDRDDTGASNQKSELWVVDMTTGGKRRVFAGDATHPSWSPSGTRIAFNSRSEFWGVTTGYALATIPATGGVPVVAFQHIDTVPRSPAWTQRGIIFDALLAGGVSIWRILVDEKSGRPLADIEPVIRTTTLAGRSTALRDGRRLLFTSAESTETIWQYSFDSARAKLLGSQRAVISGARHVYLVAAPANDAWIAAALYDEDRQDIAVVRTATGEVRALTADAYRSEVTGVSRDGTKIYFSAAVDGKREMWSIRPDGSGRELIARGAAGEDMHSGQPSPDGRFLYVLMGKALRPHVVDISVPFEKRKPVALPPLPDGRSFAWRLGDPSAAVSPDGRYLVGYPLGSSGRPEPAIEVLDLMTKTYKKIAGRPAVEGINWLPDSTRLLLYRGGELSVLDCRTGKITSAGKLDEQVPWVVLSQDGHTLFAQSFRYDADIWMLDYGDAATLTGFARESSSATAPK